ncbi:MAG: TRAP transporter small permease [Desulfobacterales bacterium]|mgnify:CR=1 FL=1|nr:TRAP transporter small permease [Desulfobacterales bacterium]MCF8079667.1 TRAP transporter small permease [Desulfobacterales bacterium]
MQTVSPTNDQGSVPALEKVKIVFLVDRLSAKMETGLNIIGVCFIMILMFFTAAEIVGRYLFNSPIPGYVEDTELMMAAIVFLGFGYAQRKGAHIRMDMVINKIRGRPYHFIHALSALFSLAAYAVICAASFKATWEAYQMGDVTEYLYTPTWPSKLCVPIGAFFLCTRLFLQMLKHTGQVVVGEQIRKIE